MYELALPSPQHLSAFDGSLRCSVTVHALTVQQCLFQMVVAPTPVFIQCQLCHMQFSDQAAMFTHYSTVHSHINALVIGPSSSSAAGERDAATTADSKHACLMCAMEFTLKATLNRHLSTVHNVKVSAAAKNCDVRFRPYQCQVCLKRFTQKHTLVTHLAVIHGVGDTKRHTCDICSKVYRYRGHLMVHIKTKHRQKPKRAKHK